MKFFLPCLFTVFLCVSSCSDKAEKPEEKTSGLPDYSHVEVDKLYAKEDTRLQNEDSILSVLDQYYTQIWEKGNLWGGFLVAKGDRILYEGYRGYAQADSTDAITAQTPLHVASVSKTITSMTVLRLVEAGKIKLEEPLTTYFDNFPYPEVTVRSLLTQRSGLPKYEHFIDKIDKDAPELTKDYLTNTDVLNMLIKYHPDAARTANTGFMYCNTNYALLASLVERVTKTSFPEAVKEIVFEPLGMKNSYVLQREDLDSAAKSFFQRGPKVYPYDRLDLIYGDKNVYTTPRDLLRFSYALYAKNFLPAELKEKIFEPYSNEKPGVNNYGLGFRMKIFGPDQKLTYHNGWWHGSNSVFAHLLKSEVTIIAIGNKYSSRVYTALALSGLFEDFPAEREKLIKDLNQGTATALITDDYSQ